MAARPISSGTISFGLVSIPVRVFVATRSQQIHFHMVHAACGTRIKQQLYCPHDEKVVPRSEIVKGYEGKKGRTVTFTDKELDALEAEANRAIEIRAFVPLASVDPVYFEDAHYLGPEKGAESAYHLLAEAMRDGEQGAVAKFVHHGKEHVVLIRSEDGGLILHALYYGDEVRSMKDVVGTRKAAVKPKELSMARKLIEELSEDGFRPEAYRDEYRTRLLKAIEQKRKGKEEITAEPAPKREKVVDLMEALRSSLEGSMRRTGSRRRVPTRKRAGTRKRAARRPAPARR
jgi:DNA end-binding protein Ku